MWVEIQATKLTLGFMQTPKLIGVWINVVKWNLWREKNGEHLQLSSTALYSDLSCEDPLLRYLQNNRQEIK